jgi:eukaryotic-like serine/threonine-protein kinase
MSDGDEVRFAFSGELRLLGRIGQGGMGEVYEAAYTAPGGVVRRVVVKRLLPRLRHEARLRELFFHEARLTAQLGHPHIIQILGIGELQGEPVLIMEHIDGRTLNEVTAALREDDIAVGVGAAVIRDVGRALAYAHELTSADGTPLRLVHRDVSPSNIMMTREGTVKLIDFGIATRSGTRDSSLTGKPAYMAPEMVVELRADNRSDLFSLGAVLFEMLTLQRLFQGETTAEVLEKVITGNHPSPRSLNPRIPDGVLAIVRTALQRDPARRYASAGEMGAACEHFLYDKGYGPTNLSLKEYVSALFPEAAPLTALDTGPGFPVVESTLLPIADPAAQTRVRDTDHTPPARRHEYTVAVSRPGPADAGSATIAPGAGAPARPRRIKTRIRPR